MRIWWLGAAFAFFCTLSAGWAQDGTVIYESIEESVEIRVEPLGWNGDGYFAAAFSKQEGGETSHRLLVQNMVSDEVLHDSGWGESVGLDFTDFLRSTEVREKLRGYGVRDRSGSFSPSKVLPSPWDYLGFEVLYSSSAFQMSAEIILYVVPEVRIPDQQALNRAKLKAVWSDEDSNAPVVVGHVLSPYENRAAVVATRTVTGPKEEVFLVGCHLTYGYEPQRVEKYR
jgi:hypothetical protein